MHDTADGQLFVCNLVVERVRNPKCVGQLYPEWKKIYQHGRKEGREKTMTIRQENFGAAKPWRVLRCATR